ncbi:hypothetical protein ACSQ67_000548 [Phaseolus vulgaris]
MPPSSSPSSGIAFTIVRAKESMPTFIPSRSASRPQAWSWNFWCDIPSSPTNDGPLQKSTETDSVAHHWDKK